MEERAYQGRSIESTLAGFGEWRKQLGVCPTGGGKTIIFAKLAESVARAGLPAMEGCSNSRRTLILAHRDELIGQAVDKVFSTTGIMPEVEKAERYASDGAQIVVGSIQSVMGRFERFKPDDFGLVVCDEAHHSVSASWQRPLSYFVQGGARVLGVTATPDRGDKKQLGSFYENIAFEISLFELIRQGFLSPIKVKALPLKIDLSGVRTTAGDFNDGDLGDALAPYLREIAQQLKTQAAGRKSLVFVPLIATSKVFVDICQGLGIRARHVDGNSPDRKEILQAFRRGEFDLLSNAMLLTEGYDEPSIDCVVILRPTQSRPLYSQMVGRGTRIHPGKSGLLLLDFLWLHERHNLIRPAHLIAKDAAMAEAMTAIVEKGADWDALQGEFDLEELESKAREQRERKLREELESKAKRVAKSVDALEYCLGVGNFEGADYAPTMDWHSKGVSDGQKRLLEQSGIDVESVRGRGHASAIIDSILTRRKLNMATPKQVHWLRHFGHPGPSTATFDEATAYLDCMFGRRKRKGREEELAVFN